MRILHLISNHKFTGPVDPALFLIEGLNKQEDVDVLTGVGKVPDGMEDKMARAVARDRGLKLVEELRLRKHRRLFHDHKEIKQLRKVIADFCPDIVHTHIGNDLFLAAKAGARPLVHSLYVNSLKELSFAGRRLVKKKPPGIIVHSRHLFEEIQAGNKRVLYVPPPLDLARFDPGRTLVPDKKFSVPDGRIAVGIVARMQYHRRFDVLLQSFKEAVKKIPELMLIIVGRGTNQEAIAKRPVRDLGLGDHVLFTGYVSGDDYVSILKQFAFLIFLVPGTDGTCRALREGMAMALPVIGSGLGMIPELIADREGGLVVQDLKAGLASAIVTLANDREMRTRLGMAARKRAEAFDLHKVAYKVFNFYRELVG